MVNRLIGLFADGKLVKKSGGLNNPICYPTSGVKTCSGMCTKINVHCSHTSGIYSVSNWVVECCTLCCRYPIGLDQCIKI